MISADDVIQALGLVELQGEGGMYRQTYRADETIPQAALPARYAEDRLFYGAIYYLLRDDPDSFSALHTLPTDELWHFYLGDPVELLQLYPEGKSARVILGQDILKGQQVQYLVPKGVWMGARLVQGGKWALMGTTMSPAFEDGDYQGGERAILLAQYPEQAPLITALTRA